MSFTLTAMGNSEVDILASRMVATLGKSTAATRPARTYVAYFCQLAVPEAIALKSFASPVAICRIRQTNPPSAAPTMSTNNGALIGRSLVTVTGNELSRNTWQNSFRILGTSYHM